MKSRTMRRQFRKAVNEVVRDNYRAMWSRLCGLRWRERIRLAYMLVRKDSDLNKFRNQED